MFSNSFELKNIGGGVLLRLPALLLCSGGAVGHPTPITLELKQSMALKQAQSVATWMAVSREV